MKSIYRNALSLILLFAVSGRASESLLNLADSLYVNGFYDEAITEYKRYLFLYPDNDIQGEVDSKISYCYAYQNDFKNSIAYIDKAALHARDDSLTQHLQIDRDVIEIASGELREASGHLERIINNTRYNDVRERAVIILFSVTVLQHDWRAAYDIYLRNIDEEIFRSDSLVTLLEKALGISYKSPDAAEMLSTFFPGAGQVYAGGFLAGLNALAINGSTAYLTVSEFLNERYINGALSFVFLFQRYYSGNRYHARRIADEHNHRSDNLYEDLIISLLASRYGIETKAGF